ncbi:MAG: hypothetical protein OXI69_15435 [Acidobacteriota bacterium]|nr:hypothetical protein [Acidobacteriota bacterium]
MSAAKESCRIAKAIHHISNVQGRLEVNGSWSVSSNKLRYALDYLYAAMGCKTCWKKCKCQCED